MSHFVPCALLITAFSCQPQLYEPDLERIVAEVPRASGAPGAVMAVSYGGRTWIGASGLDSLEPAAPMDIDRVFPVASVTKLFTGAVVMQLVEEGALSLDSRLSDVYPDFPHADDITVDTLLSHTAGVSTEWFEAPEFQALLAADLSRQLTPAEVIALVADNPPHGEPGSGYAYSNAGYVLLGEMAHAVTGTPIDELIRTRIIDPLALSDTSYRYDHPPDQAHGYFEFFGGLFDVSIIPQDAVLSLAGAAGAVHATPSDALRFIDALFTSDSVVQPDSLAHMTSEIAPGARYGRAMMMEPSWGVQEDGARAGYGHGGHLPGYWCLAVHYPDVELSVVVVINRDVVGGMPIDRSALDAAARSVYELIR